MNKLKKMIEILFQSGILEFNKKENSDDLFLKIVKELDIVNDKIDFDTPNNKYFNLLNKQKFDLLLGEMKEYTYGNDELKNLTFNIDNLDLRYAEKVFNEIKEEIFNKTFADLIDNDNLSKIPYSENLSENLEYALNLKEKEDIITTEYHKIYNTIRELKFSKAFLSKKNNVLKEYAISIIDVKLIYNHLIGEGLSFENFGGKETFENFNINNHKTSIYDIADFENINSDMFLLFIFEYIVFIYSINDMNFYKEKLKELKTNVSGVKKEQKETKRNTEYYSEVFLNEPAENFVLTVLKEVGVLNAEHKAIKRGFQTPCNDIWKLNDRSRNYIFKKSATLKQFIEFLNRECSANIKALDKLSQSNRYTDDIKSKVEVYIKQNEISYSE